MFVRVFNRHFLADFAKSFLLTVGVLTFVMYIGSVVKAIDYLSRGASGMLIMKVFALNIPFTLSFVIPMSALVTSLLQFGRLSADGEVTAMRACGLSLPQMAAPFLVVGVLLSAFCLWLNAEVAPRSHFERRQMLRDLTKENPLTLIEEATFVDDFPGVSVYVGRKDGNHIQDVILYQYEDGRRRADVEAASGEVAFDPEAGRLSILLENVRITEYDKANPRDLSKTRTLVAESYPLALDVSKLLKKGSINKKPSDMPMRELLRSIRDVRQAFPSLQEDSVGKMRTKMAVEATQRLALALACFSFVLVAVPLGVRPTRRETSGGIWMALVLFMFFYLFIIVSDALVDKPDLRPELIPLFPVLVLQAYGFWKLWRLR